MKVLHVLTSDKLSGAEKVAIDIIKSLDDEFEFTYISKNGSIKDILSKKNIKNILLEKVTIKKLNFAIKELKPDIIHAHDLRASVYSALVSLLFNNKIISQIHYNAPTMRKVNITSILYLIASLFFDSILVVSRQIKEEYIFSKFIEKKIAVLPNMINIGEWCDLKYDRKFNPEFDLLFVGRLVDAKDPIRFINIVSYIKEKIPNIKAVMVGDGELFEVCKDKIYKENLNNNIIMTGFDENPFKYMNKSRVLIAPSRYEGFGLAVVEAMSIGLPVLSTDTGGLRDIIENNICGFRCKNDSEFVEKFISINNNKELYTRLSQGSKEKSLKYTNYELYKERLINIYRKEK